MSEISNNNHKIAVVINKNGMGYADPELSQTLIKNYLALLEKESKVPAYICLYAEGVRLACKGSTVIEELKALEKAGCSIVICRTCLGFYNLIDQVETGSVGTMIDIIDVQHNSTKVITL